MHQCDALAVTPTAGGAQLRCVFQQMERRGHARGLVADFDRYLAGPDGERLFPFAGGG
jgi:hypothetical protein